MCLNRLHCASGRLHCNRALHEPRKTKHARLHCASGRLHCSRALHETRKTKHDRTHCVSAGYIAVGPGATRERSCELRCIGLRLGRFATFATGPIGSRGLVKGWFVMGLPTCLLGQRAMGSTHMPGAPIPQDLRETQDTLRYKTGRYLNRLMCIVYYLKIFYLFNN